MILLWFILGIILIFGIARYNESNKLFWMLLFSLVMGFAGTKMVLDINHGKKQSNVNLTQVYSTQELNNSVKAVLFNTEYTSTTESVTGLAPVGQSFTPDECEINIALSKVFGRTRDQPINKYSEPYLRTPFFDTS